MIHSLRLLCITLWCASLGESRSGTIVEFSPPAPDDWLEAVEVGSAEVEARGRDGRLVTEAKLDLYSARLERYCRETFQPPRITSLQWYKPPKMKCKGGHYFVLRLLYDDYTIDCLRVTTSDEDTALASVKPYVIKRFFLKVYYLTVSGDCYVKYFELPYRQCTDEGHIKLPARMCEEHFTDDDDDLPSSSYDDDDDLTVANV